MKMYFCTKFENLGRKWLYDNVRLYNIFTFFDSFNFKTILGATNFLLYDGK